RIHTAIGRRGRFVSDQIAQRDRAETHAAVLEEMAAGSAQGERLIEAVELFAFGGIHSVRFGVDRSDSKWRGFIPA
ncbi:MAG: hypothetical protein ACI9OD_005044, partial [Limisphaerales bacterium]